MDESAVRTVVGLQIVRPTDGRLLWSMVGVVECSWIVVWLDAEGGLWGIDRERTIPAPWRLERVTADGTQVVGSSEDGINGVKVGRVVVQA